MSSPEIGALHQMRTRHRLVSALDAIAQDRSRYDHGHLSASTERRAQRSAEKATLRRKKAKRKQSRR